jgi:hypothetical protein
MKPDPLSRPRRQPESRYAADAAFAELGDAIVRDGLRQAHGSNFWHSITFLQLLPP